jgi:hypothetical protein
MLEIVKIIAEVFDTGDKESVYTKGKEFRSKEITAMALSTSLWRLLKASAIWLDVVIGVPF